MGPIKINTWTDFFQAPCPPSLLQARSNPSRIYFPTLLLHEEQECLQSQRCIFLLIGSLESQFKIG